MCESELQSNNIPDDELKDGIIGPLAFEPEDILRIRGVEIKNSVIVVVHEKPSDEKINDLREQLIKEGFTEATIVHTKDFL